MIRNRDAVDSGEEDARFLAPLLTVTEAGRNLLISPTTVKDWKTRELVHSVAPVRRGAPTLPLAGVAEAQVLRGLRLSGLSPVEIVLVTRSLREELGEYALIKERLAHDGRSVFRDVARRIDAPQWVRVRDGQLLLPKVVDDHLTYLEWAPDGFPVRLRLRSYRQANADVILDPRFGYGKPVFERTKVRTKDVMRQFLAGENLRISHRIMTSPKTRYLPRSVSSVAIGMQSDDVHGRPNQWAARRGSCQHIMSAIQR